MTERQSDRETDRRRERETDELRDKGTDVRRSSKGKTFSWKKSINIWTNRQGDRETVI